MYKYVDRLSLHVKIKLHVLIDRDNNKITGNNTNALDQELQVLRARNGQELQVIISLH